MISVFPLACTYFSPWTLLRIGLPTPPTTALHRHHHRLTCCLHRTNYSRCMPARCRRASITERTLRAAFGYPPRACCPSARALLHDSSAPTACFNSKSIARCCLKRQGFALTLDSFPPRTGTSSTRTIRRCSSTSKKPYGRKGRANSLVRRRWWRLFSRTHSEVATVLRSVPGRVHITFLLLAP